MNKTVISLKKLNEYRDLFSTYEMLKGYTRPDALCDLRNINDLDFLENMYLITDSINEIDPIYKEILLNLTTWSR